MKITDIRSMPVWAGHRNLFVLKIETDEGVHGWGESGVSGRELAVEGAVAHFREFLVGKDPMRIGALWQEMYRGQYFEGGRILTGAMSAIDIALYDIVGKSLGVPVHQLLGGAQRDSVPCFVTTPVPPAGPEFIEDVRRLIAEGWSVVRCGPAHPDTGGDDLLFEPRESIALTADWLTKTRNAVGTAPVLGIDYHHRLSVAEAASFCQMMSAHTLDFLEEPIRDETPGAYESLRSMTDVPFAIGEEFSSKWAFLPYVEAGLANYCRIDVCNVGGFTESMKVAGWCEAHYIDLMPHNPRLARSAPPPTSIWRRPSRTTRGSKTGPANFLSTTRCFRSSRSGKGTATGCRPVPGWGSSSTRIWRGSLSSSGRRPTCTGATARIPTGSEQRVEEETGLRPKRSPGTPKAGRICFP